jgi:hypothetical protein
VIASAALDLHQQLLMASERTTYLHHPLALHAGPVGHDEGFPTEAVLDPWEDERGDLVVFDELVEATDAIFGQADGLGGPLGPVALVGEDSDLLVVGEQVARGLEIGKKGALVGLLVLVVAVGPDEFVVLRRDTVGIGDITDPTQVLQSTVSHQQLCMTRSPLTVTVSALNNFLV